MELHVKFHKGVLGIITNVLILQDVLYILVHLMKNANLSQIDVLVMDKNVLK